LLQGIRVRISSSWQNDPGVEIGFAATARRLELFKDNTIGKGRTQVCFALVQHT